MLDIIQGMLLRNVDNPIYGTEYWDVWELRVLYLTFYIEEIYVR